MKTYLKLKEIFNEASLTSDIAGILHWDMATMMPSSSRDQRSEQLAYLSKTRIKKVVIMIIFLKLLDLLMLIIHITKNIKIEIIEVEVEVQRGKLLIGLRQVLLLKKY